MAPTKTKRLGEILLEAGTITPDKLDLALTEQKQTREKLGVILQRLGICSEKEISRVLAGQAGVKSVSLLDHTVDRQALNLITQETAEKYSVLPFAYHNRNLTLAMANPLDLVIIDQISRKTGCYVEVVHTPESEILDAIVRYYGAADDDSCDLTEAIDIAATALAHGRKLEEENSPFVALVNLLLAKGIDAGATDIHLEPEEKVLRCRYRIDGRLIQGPILPRELQSIVIARMKILAELNISESRVPQDGRIVFQAKRRKVDLRVSTFPTVYGETIVCRVLDKENLIVGLERLGMDKSLLSKFRRDITRPHGIILVTGPTGSGKTTTLYSALTYLNKPDTKIITLEDPVEYELPVINQAQVNTAKGFTFAKGLRAILRQDPDILLIGEIRDKETAQMAIRAALTGHLVFSTLHTNSAAGAIPRLIDMGVEPFLLSATLVSIVAQRLVRKVCTNCQVPYSLTDDDRLRLGLDEAEVRAQEMVIGEGCSNCGSTGHRGRIAVFEYLQISSRISAMIAEGQDAATIVDVARQDGMQNLRENALDKLYAGKTSVAEIARVIA